MLMPTASTTTSLLLGSSLYFAITDLFQNCYIADIKYYTKAFLLVVAGDFCLVFFLPGPSGFGVGALGFCGCLLATLFVVGLVFAVGLVLAIDFCILGLPIDIFFLAATRVGAFFVVTVFGLLFICAFSPLFSEHLKLYEMF